MLDLDVLFGELRSLLQEAPSEALWWRLCEHLDLWSEEPLAQLAAPYVAEHLERWPDGVRREAPDRWLTSRLLAPLANHIALRGYAEPLSQLAASPRAPAPSLDMSLCGLSAAQLDGLLSTPCLEGVRALDLSLNTLGAEVLPILARSPQLAALHTLDLSLNRLFYEAGSGGLRDLALPQLRALNLSFNMPLTIDDLLAAPCAGQLEQLDLRHTSLRDDALVSIAAGGLPSLRSLKLSGNSFGERGLRALLASTHLSSLEHLDAPTSLGALPMSRSALFALLDASAMPALRTMSLHLGASRCERLYEDDLARLTHHPGLARVNSLTIGAADAPRLRALLASPHLGALAELEVCFEERAADLLAELDTHPVASQLRVLRLGGLRSVPQKIAPLENMTRLTRLYLDDWPPGDQRALLSSPCLTNLTTLRLAEAADEACLRLLATSPHLSSLQALDLGRCRLHEAQLLALLNSPHLTRLRRLDLTSCELVGAPLRALALAPSAGRLRDLLLPPNAASPALKRLFASSPHLHPALRRKGRA